MPDQQRIFLSMVSDEFRSYRELLCSDLERGQVEVTTQEKFGTSGKTTLEKLDDHIRQCSAVIHLVGDGLGHLPKPAEVDAILEAHPGFLDSMAGKCGLTREQLGECSYTQWEAYLAIFRKVRVHIYRAEKTAPREPDFEVDENQKQLQQAHFERIEGLGRDRDEVRSAERLSSFVLADLKDILPPRETGAEIGRRHLQHEAKELIGREPWLARLDEAWSDPHCHVVVIQAWGGIGKTALVAAWMAEMDYKGWREARRVFDWSFYSQGTRQEGEAAISADVFIAEALGFFGDPDPHAGSPGDRGERLAQLVGASKSLLVLDGIEPLQHPPGPMAGHIADPALTALLRGLATRNAGLCLVTTREHVVDLDGRKTVDEWSLDHLSEEAGAALLHLHGGKRAGDAAIGSDDAELRAASGEVAGHALTLTLMAKYLALACDGDIRQRDTFRFSEADLEWVTSPDPNSPYGHAFKVISAYERWYLDETADRSDAERRICRIQVAILKLMGLFNRPAPADCLAALRKDPVIEGLTGDLAGLPDKDWKIAVSRLEEVDLVKRHGPDGAAFGLDAHPLVREYFAKQLREQQPEAFRAAHSRLFNHLCENTEHRPDTLAGLQPLYQAVNHGCQAERQQEACEKVYRDRILRGTGHDGFYSSKKLAAIGANLGGIAAFFEEPWSRLSPNLTEANQSWILTEAAFYLRALGRLTEAVEPVRVAGEMVVKEGDWENAARVYSNLSQLETTLGRLDEAVADGRRSIDFADRSRDAFFEMGSRAIAGDALHQAGERAEAGEWFAEAERIQADDQLEFPLLYSLPGFQYVDWILAPAERPAAAASTATGNFTNSAGEADEALAACVEAERRSTQTLKWVTPENWLLDIALDHLTLARTALYRALKEGETDSDFAAIADAVKTALDKLRQANSLHHLPKALLTAALHAGAVARKADDARRFLDEAEEIAERGPMPLYLADVHLHRARLFRDRTSLDKARALIDELGYGRRREELADAEAAAVAW